MPRSCFLLVCIFFSMTVFAQQKTAISVLSRSKNDGISLRWAPTDALNWQLGNKYGYNIERFTITADGDLEQNSKVVLTPAPLKPLTPAEFLPLAERSDEVATLQELLYGEGSEPPQLGSDLAAILSENNDLQNRFGIAMLMCDLSLDAARAAGLFLKDTKVVRGERYIYRIRIAHDAASNSIEPSVIIVSHTEEKPLLEIKDLKADFGDKSATLHWSTLLHKGVYTAYYLERSTDGKSYMRITDLPYIHMTEALEAQEAVFVDSLESNLKEYFYRIQGITPFSEVGPYSNTVSGEAKENLFGQLVLSEGKAFEKNKVRIAWAFPEHLEKQIGAFMISRASNPDGPYIDVAKKDIARNVREFVDQTPLNNTYYIVKAIDKDRREITRSFPFLVQIADNTPPTTPIGITGNIDASGLTTLTWQANKDGDLLGYRIFRSNARQQEPVEITVEILTDAYYADTINVRLLNRKVYYYVVAVDRNYNTSDYSAACELVRPDIIPPAAPVFTKTEVSKDTVTLQWINSPSLDVARTELIRVEKEKRLSQVVRTWSPLTPLDKWIDGSVVPGTAYQYKVVVYDSAGNSNQTVSREILYEPGYRKSITDIKTSVDRDARKVVIEWKNPQPSMKCIVYRKTNGNPLTIYRTLEGNIESFTDEEININNSYSYKIQPVFSRGIKAILSKEIKVTY